MNMSKTGKWAAGIGVIATTVVSGLILYSGQHFLDTLFNGNNAPGGEVASRPMGALERNTDRHKQDIYPFGRYADNAKHCSEMCQLDRDCDAMTFVISTRTCWLKNGVPEATYNPDMISAKKVPAI